jgi:hypothetical protein
MPSSTTVADPNRALQKILPRESLYLDLLRSLAA